MAKNENIVADLIMDGDKPVSTANPNNERMIMHNFINDPFLELPIGLRRNVINNNIKPTCKPETDNTCTAPAY